MVEVLVASVIVGMMVVAALDAIGMAARTRRINADRLTGPGLARDLLAEIMALPYEDPESPGGGIGVDAGESSSARATFDDVDDYHNWSSASGVNRDGTSRNGYAGWTHAVTVAWADRDTAAAGPTSESYLKRITVTVTSPAGVVTQYVGLRSKWGALEQTLPVSGAVVNWAGVELRTGSSARSQFMASPLANDVPDAN